MSMDDPIQLAETQLSQAERLTILAAQNLRRIDLDRAREVAELARRLRRERVGMVAANIIA